MGMSLMQHMSWQGHGMATVVSGGTPNAIAVAGTVAKRVRVKCVSAGPIYVGLAGMSKTLNAKNLTCGYHIKVDQETPWLIVPGDDLSNVFIDGTTDEDVTFFYEG